LSRRDSQLGQFDQRRGSLREVQIRHKGQGGIRADVAGADRLALGIKGNGDKATAQTQNRLIPQRDLSTRQRNLLAGEGQQERKNICQN
jgi:hypothetical protein